MSNTATIQKISNLRAHPNADALELCDIKGWQVVVKKGEFREGDLCVYIEVDSVVEERPEYEFLRKVNFRIKPTKLRGERSNGICFPISIIDLDTFDGISDSLYVDGEPISYEGYDVSKIVGAKHYEKPVPAQLAGQIVGHRPGFISKTDETNIRSNLEILGELQGLSYYISRKDDGSSGTFFLKDGEFGVCSRNLQLKEDDKNGFWRMARKYDLETHLRNWMDNMVIQGEVVGPGVNGNNLGLQDLELHIFSIVDLKTRELVSFHELVTRCNMWKVPMVTVLEIGHKFEYELHELISLANAQLYPNGKPAEGIVIRPTKHTKTNLDMTWNALSGKIINENYKEKE